MSGRMEKVREALDQLIEKGWRSDPQVVAAAFVEVEEWEAEREFLAGINKALLPYQERAVAAEAERDRLREWNELAAHKIVKWGQGMTDADWREAQKLLADLAMGDPHYR